MRVNRPATRLTIGTVLVTPLAITSTILTGTVGLNMAITIPLDVIAAVLLLGLGVQRVMHAEHEHTRQVIQASFEKLSADVVQAIGDEKGRADKAQRATRTILATYNDGSNVRPLH